MPIEIRELHIKINVKDHMTSSNTENGNSIVSNKQEIIAECVETVMEILDQKEER